MSSRQTETFIRALHDAERAGDPGPLVELFTEDATLDSGPQARRQRGRDGARSFWREYLGTFEGVHSDFTHVHETEDAAVLEWRSEGRLRRTGQPIEYRGVSVVEFDGERVKRFATYYDSAAFLPGGSKHGREKGGRTER